jgi:hypothetical protein
MLDDDDVWHLCLQIQGSEHSFTRTVAAAQMKCYCTF